MFFVCFTKRPWRVFGLMCFGVFLGGCCLEICDKFVIVCIL